ncbi:hypothetical protein ANCCAN_05875 [Ancylostoma caninum]|uniref:Uncharacterized protein n=1 Tax=Ancylostoma caninum TaxID=29170 RepID=A0A368GXI2_ANCCA|nr:hypothetical protein ANCCAN_05875 [Ancylostoma caninum]
MLQSARKTSHIDAGVLNDVHNVLSNKQFSSATRLAAAKLLVHAENIQYAEITAHHSAIDWIMLTALLESADKERIARIFKIWMVCFEKRRIRDSDDEAVFLASFARILSRRGEEVFGSFTLEETKKFRKNLLITFVILSELERGSKFFESAIQFVAKTMSLLEFCLYELPAHVRGRYGILKVFLRETALDSEVEKVIGRICQQLNEHLSSQLITNAAADLVATLVRQFPGSLELQKLFSANATHHLKCVRWNVLRWFGRIDASKESCHFFLALRTSLREKFLNIDEDLWPPLIWETEDVSCVDSRWDCEEAEDILWAADRALDAYLNVSAVLQQKFHYELDRNDPLIHAGLKWHLAEIRLAAFRLWSSCLGTSLQEPDNNKLLGHSLEEFILSNGMSSLASLRKEVEIASNSCTMTQKGRSEWMHMLRTLTEKEKLDRLQRGTSYLPDDLNELQIPLLPPPKQAKEQLEELLKISGSSDAKSCPAFPILYKNLAKAGYDQRVFARFMIDLFNLIRSHEDVKVALDVISDAVTRCRLKVVVDHGCTIVDELLSTHHSDKHFFYLVEYFYCWAMNRLIDKDTQSRTLPLSRILWSVCEKSQDLMKICFEACRSTLADSSLDSKVHERVLKTLKLFASKADCRMPADFVEFLFWHCVDAQQQDEFLVRSAATILFGFVVRYITKSRSVPAFFVVATRAKFWHEVVKRCSSFSELPSLQRILLLIFLTRLYLGHPLCYSETVQAEIQTMMSSVISLVSRTKDIRERRFCMEVAAALSPPTAHVGVLKMLEEREENDENQVMRADCDFLEYILKKFDRAVEELPNHRGIPTDLHQSPYVGLIESSRTLDPEQALMETQKIFTSVESHSAELTLQALAMALTRVAVNLRAVENVHGFIRTQLVAQCLAILDHPDCSSRAVSIISRVPVCLGLTKHYLQKCYVVQILKQWENRNEEAV